MKVLITGGTGFIGKYVVKNLLKNETQIRVLTRNKDSVLMKISENPLYEVVEGDLTKPETIIGIANGCTAVIHLAAMGHVSAVTEKALKEFRDINVQGTINLINECKRAATVNKIVHISSTAAMGLIKKPIVDENTIPQPATPYQKSKYESELIVLEEAKKHNISACVLRPCMVYGPGGLGEFNKICKLIKKGVFPKVGTGKNLTPAVFVSDVADAIVLALNSGKRGEVYLITDKESHDLNIMRNIIVNELYIKRPYPYIPVWAALSIAKILEMVCLVLKRQPIVNYRNMLSTVTDRVFDISKAKKDLGYYPQISLSTGIKKTIEWYRETEKI